eukprot:579440-Rhodomonas_salina.2
MHFNPIFECSLGHDLDRSIGMSNRSSADIPCTARCPKTQTLFRLSVATREFHQNYRSRPLASKA